MLGVFFYDIGLGYVVKLHNPTLLPFAIIIDMRIILLGGNESDFTQYKSRHVRHLLHR